LTRSAVLIFNPAAGRQRATAVVERVRRELAARGIDAEPRPTATAGHATTLAAEAAREGAEVVFAYGGDGTLREAARGLLGTAVPLGPLAGGTTNVLVRALGLSRDPLTAARQQATAEPCAMDVGLCGGEPFLMMVSGGLDARILKRQSPRWKARLGPAAVALGGVGQWWSYPYPALEVEADGERLSGSLVAVCNIPLYGGSFRMAPGARLDDGLLDLIVFRGGGRWSTLAFATSLLAARHIHRRDVEVRQVRQVRFVAPDGPELQLDGDPLPAVTAPVLVRVAEEKLWVLCTLPHL
jgi:diacylglycerol kinase (ATP)